MTTNQKDPLGDLWGNHTHDASAVEQPHQEVTAEDVERALALAREPEPATGLRGWWNRLTGKGPKPLSPQEQQMKEWVRLIRTPAHNHRIAVSSHKGGVGKTTTSLAVGSVLAMYRPDLTVVIDANPDQGTLASRLPGTKQHKMALRDLIANADEIRSSQDLRQFTHTAPTRLEVLASDQDPYKSRGVSRDEYDLVQRVLGTYRDVQISDTGTDLTLPLFDEIVEYTDTLVVPASNAADEAKSAMNTLDTWYTRGTGNRGAALVPNSVVAILVKPTGKVVDLGYLRQVFESRVRRVVFIPSDPYLMDGITFDWDALQPATQRAYIELTAAICEGFPR